MSNCTFCSIYIQRNVHIRKKVVAVETSCVYSAVYVFG